MAEAPDGGMRYDVELFDPAPCEELVCTICRCIFSDAVESPCQHVFCRSCIETWLATSSNCPNCRKRVTKHTLRPVLPLVKNMIGKLMMKCENQDKGCPERVVLESYEAHKKICEFEQISCKNGECKTLKLRKDMDRHDQKECSYRMVRCRRECELELPYNVIKKHSCMAELKKRLQAMETICGLYRDLCTELEELKKKQAELIKRLSENSSLRQRLRLIDNDVLLQPRAELERTAAGGGARPRRSDVFNFQPLADEDRRAPRRRPSFTLGGAAGQADSFNFRDWFESVGSLDRAPAAATAVAGPAVGLSEAVSDSFSGLIERANSVLSSMRNLLSSMRLEIPEVPQPQPPSPPAWTPPSFTGPRWTAPDSQSTVQFSFSSYSSDTDAAADSDFSANSVLVLETDDDDTDIFMSDAEDSLLASSSRVTRGRSRNRRTREQPEGSSSQGVSTTDVTPPTDASREPVPTPPDSPWEQTPSRELSPDLAPAVGSPYTTNLSPAAASHYTTDSDSDWVTSSARRRRKRRSRSLQRKIKKQKLTTTDAGTSAGRSTQGSNAEPIPSTSTGTARTYSNKRKGKEVVKGKPVNASKSTRPQTDAPVKPTIMVPQVVLPRIDFDLMRLSERKKVSSRKAQQGSKRSGGPSHTVTSSSVAGSESLRSAIARFVRSTQGEASSDAAEGTSTNRASAAATSQLAVNSTNRASVASTSQQGTEDTSSPAAALRVVRTDTPARTAESRPSKDATASHDWHFLNEWSPADSDDDDNVLEELEPENDYEVRVPVSTMALLERYGDTSEDDFDPDWTPDRC